MLYSLVTLGAFGLAQAQSVQWTSLYEDDACADLSVVTASSVPTGMNCTVMDCLSTNMTDSAWMSSDFACADTYPDEADYTWSYSTFTSENCAADTQTSFYGGQGDFCVPIGMGAGSISYKCSGGKLTVESCTDEECAEGCQGASVPNGCTGAAGAGIRYSCNSAGALQPMAYSMGALTAVLMMYLQKE